jgi:phage baseplate assembly protein W
MAIITAVEQAHVDLDFGFNINPNVGDIGRQKNVNAIRQSVLNILKTNHGERPFNPLFGANLRSFLFENIDGISIVAIADAVETAIKNDEPRVKVLNVVVKSNSDNNEVDITCTIEIISTGNTITVSTALERIR